MDFLCYYSHNISIYSLFYSQYLQISSKNYFLVTTSIYQFISNWLSSYALTFLKRILISSCNLYYLNLYILFILLYFYGYVCQSKKFIKYKSNKKNSKYTPPYFYNRNILDISLYFFEEDCCIMLKSIYRCILYIFCI